MNETSGETGADVAVAPAVPSVGSVDFGDLGGATPIGRKFGFDRGQCIDRFYIERFLELQAGHIRGRVLEVAEDTYTRRFGGAKVTSCDILHATGENRRATLVGDLCHPEQFPDGVFDCAILTQTLQHVYDVGAALTTAYRLLRPGGVALISVPGISQISRYDMDRWGDYWRFTTCSLTRLLESVFGSGACHVEAHGNVRAAVAFLHGLCVADVGKGTLAQHDADFELVLTAVARVADESP